MRQRVLAYDKLRCLYMPAVEHYFGRPTAGLQVVRALQHRVQGWLFEGPEAEISLPAEEVGTWFLRV